MAGRKGQRGWGRIRQLPNRARRYQASYCYPRGTTARHNAPTTFGTRALAERWLSDERRLIETGLWAPPGERIRREVIRAQTFGDFATRWIEERNIKESSRVEYRRLLKNFITDTLGPLPLHALDAQAVRAWYAALDTTPHRKFKVYWFLHSICATAVSDGLLSPNPCQMNVKKPDRIVTPGILEDEEVEAAVNVIAPQYVAPVLIMTYCGLRLGELGELRRKDISDNVETITVARRVRHDDGGCSVDTPKNGKSHTKPVPEDIRTDIKHHLDTYLGTDPEALLLPGRAKCGHLSAGTFRKAFHDALKASGCQRVRLHDLKHLNGVMVYESGASLSESMDWLNHSSPSASMIYQDVRPRRRGEIAASVSARREAARAKIATRARTIHVDPVTEQNKVSPKSFNATEMGQNTG